MKNFTITACLLLIINSLAAQNIGIGLTTPATQLHLQSSSSNSLRIDHTGGGGSSLELKTNNGPFDWLFLTKWANGASGSLAGISLSNLSQVMSGTNAGALMTGTISSSPMYFVTGNSERMRINADGHVGINTTNPEFGWLHVTNNDNSASVFGKNTYNGGLAFSLSGEITGASGAGVIGTSTTAGMSSGFSPGAYGVVGQSGENAFGVGAFSYGTGTALFARNFDAAGLAFRSFGNVRLAGIGESNGKVLTSDNSGNATWQNLPGGSSAWTVSGNDIYNSNSGTVGVGVVPTPFAKFHAKRSDNAAAGPGGQLGAIYGENGSTNDGSGLYGVSFAPRFGATAFAGVSGLNLGTGADHFGVIGQSDGTSVGGYSAGVGGYGDNGVLGYSQSTTGAGVLAQHGTGQTALELNNGFLKVSGTNKTAFTVTAVTGVGGNTSGNVTSLNYANMSSTDIVIVTHYWQANYIGALGVFWTGAWGVFREDLQPMPNGEKFNVMVVKQ